MALETAFQALTTRLQSLRESLLELRILVVEDKPVQDDVALVDFLGDTVQDLAGWLEEALSAARDGQRAAGHPVDWHRARLSLARSHERFTVLMREFSTRLLSYERIEELLSMGQERGGEWAAWAYSVRAALDACQARLYDVQQALFLCCQEIAERAALGSPLVQATNIGQQITAPEGWSMDREGHP